MNDTADKNISLHPGGLKLTQEAFEHALLSMTAETGKAGLRAARRNKFQVKILDIGCGIGTSLAFLCKDKKYLGTGIDSSEEAIDKAKSLHPDISFRVCSASHIPFDDESFDIVLSECVLTLLDDPGYALKEWVRLLKGNGCLIISGLCKRQEDELHDPGSKLCDNGLIDIYTLKSIAEEYALSTVYERDCREELIQYMTETIFEYGSLEERIRIEQAETGSSVLDCSMEYDPKTVSYTLLIFKKLKA